ncbi:MAG: DUF971 domain-containing protein, partial [Verrucomicrobiota bacterium]
FKEMAGNLKNELEILTEGDPGRPQVSYAWADGILIECPDGPDLTIPAAELRRRCRCAYCVEELTGKQILKAEDVPDDVYPLSITPMGNYAVGISWSDGYCKSSSIYPYTTLVDIAQSLAAENP